MKKSVGLVLGAALLMSLWLIAGLPMNAHAGDHTIKAVVGDFKPGAKILVCWRMVKPGNPFLAQGAFDCRRSIKAVNAPFPGGGVNGDQLMAVVKKAAGSAAIKEVRIRALRVGKDAADPGANMMTVDPGRSEFYNSYVGRDGKGRLVLFLDIEPEGK